MMKRVKLLILITGTMIFAACGTTQEEEIGSSGGTIYDMWDYMTPSNSFQVEYDIYKNGRKNDYIIETMRVFDDNRVERESDDGITTLRLRRDAIEVRESNGETIQVQRFVKRGDRDIFQSSSIGNCTLDDFHRGITIKGIEFYRVLHVICRKGSSTNEFYYGFDEGIVATYSNNNRETIELVKIDERAINR
ncbi:MAG: hypothetical protein KAG56_05215 [Sulfurovaceae bacterium]|nr:hypothetical protein [Sulfurovaceae bacterium]